MKPRLPDLHFKHCPLFFCLNSLGVNEKICGQPAEEAMRLGLLQEVIIEDNLLVQAKKIALDLASKYLPAFASIKSLFGRPIAEDMMEHEERSICEFVDIWYSEPTWKRLQDIKIN